MTGKRYQRFVVPTNFASLNQWDSHAHWSKGARIKKDAEEAVGWCAKAAKVAPYANPVIIRFTWVEGDRTRDLDNVAAGKKFVLDGLVKCGVLRNDSWREVAGFEDRFAYDKGNPRIIVELREAEKGEIAWMRTSELPS